MEGNCIDWALVMADFVTQSYPVVSAEIAQN